LALFGSPLSLLEPLPLAHLAVIPLLQACERLLAPQVVQAWSYGYCPICGAWPTLAEVCGLEHARILRCVRCGAAWRTTWLRCPYCGEMDHQRLGVLLPEEHGATGQIDTCATCNGYLTTHTTLPALPAYAVALHDLATIALDMAALDRGYTRRERPAMPWQVVWSRRQCARASCLGGGGIKLGRIRLCAHSSAIQRASALAVLCPGRRRISCVLPTSTSTVPTKIWEPGCHETPALSSATTGHCCSVSQVKVTSDLCD
jgi:hypothetical protein